MLPCMALSQRGEYNRMQTYLKVHGGWAVGSSKYSFICNGKATACKVVHLSLILIIITSCLDSLLLEYFH